ncbi:hypothetical protein ABZ016_12675 [Streptomyces sp. NPDC006372]|uniref:hypothetical protein n=1 Tax=Streptomyces sp. NPDC006372 TaxID=3155599 RepID=UPI0033B55ADB
MQLTVHWSDLWVPASMIVLSVILSLVTRQRRHRRKATVRRGSRTHWEWLPFTFGLATALGELSFLLDLPDPWTTIIDVMARALALTTGFMVFRTVFILFMRGTRRVFRRRGADTSI